MLTGKIALVTGAGRGIGRQIALTLAQNHAHVIVNYNGSKQNAEQVVAEITQAGGSAEAIQCNVADADAGNAMVKDIIAKHGKVDILVNNAGVTRDGLVMMMKEADFDAVIDVNLKGTFNCCKAAAQRMMKQRYGRIVNLSSVVGVAGNAGQANYAASKAGVIGLTKSLARELAARNVTANAVAPGFIATDMTDALSEKQREAILGRIAAKRLGAPEDVAALVRFLASEEAGYITGQVVCIDGGMSL